MYYIYYTHHHGLPKRNLISNRLLWCCPTALAQATSSMTLEASKLDAKVMAFWSGTQALFAGSFDCDSERCIIEYNWLFLYNYRSNCKYAHNIPFKAETTIATTNSHSNSYHPQQQQGTTTATTHYCSHHNNCCSCCYQRKPSRLLAPMSAVKLLLALALHAHAAHATVPSFPKTKERAAAIRDEIAPWWWLVEGYSNGWLVEGSLMFIWKFIHGELMIGRLVVIRWWVRNQQLVTSI